MTCRLLFIVFISAVIAGLGLAVWTASITIQLCAMPLVGHLCRLPVPTLCDLPYLSLLCSRPSVSEPSEMSTNFSLLADLETRAFERLLDEVAIGPTSATAVKKAQKLSLHLLQAVQVSRLEPEVKDPLVHLLRQIAEDSDEVFVALVDFHAKVDAAARRVVHGFLSNLASLGSIRTGQLYHASPLASSLSPPQREYSLLLDAILLELDLLGSEVGIALSRVEKLEHALDQIHNLTLIQYSSAREARDREASRWLTRVFGWDTKVLQGISEARELLVHVAELQQRASGYIVNARTVLLMVNANLRALKSEAIAITSSHRGFPLQHQFLSLSIGLDRLRTQSSKAERAVAERVRSIGLRLPGQP